MKRLLLILTVVLFLIKIAYAQPITVEVSSVYSEVEAGSDARFTLKITNNGPERDAFKMSANDFQVFPFSEIASKIKIDPEQVKLDPGQSEEAIVTIKTLDTAKAERKYLTEVEIKSLVNPTITETITLETTIIQPKDVIQVTADFPKEITPGDRVDFEVYFKNRANLAFEDLELAVTSTLPKFNKKEKISLLPKEEKELVLRFETDEQTSPGDYVVNIRLYKGDELKGSLSSAFTVERKENVEEKKDLERGFLSSKTTITLKNLGNVPVEKRLEIGASLLRRIFSEIKPEPEVEDGKYVWEFTLDPQEEVTLEIYTNFRPLFYGFLIIAVFVILMIFYVDRSVIIKKKIYKLKEDKSGATELKILLYVKNGGFSTLNEVKVLDIIPHMVELRQEFGTLSPTRVQKGERGLRMIWMIGKLDGREERVFTYKARTKFKVLGEASLPPAMMQYVNRKGRLKTVRSARVLVTKKAPESEEE